MRIRHAIITSLLSLLPLAACTCGEEVIPGCTTDAECMPGERCVPPPPMSTAAGMCVVNPDCVADEECTDEDPRKRCDVEGETFTCVFRDGFADDCDVTRPCPFGQFCSELIGKCFDSAASRDCTRRSQCPNDQICDRNANKCIPDTGCYGDNFCEDGELCDLVDHVCRSVSVECVSCLLTGMCEGSDLCAIDTRECTGAGEMPACRTGEQCDPLGRCVQCTNSDECGPGLFCNVALGRCESNVQCADQVTDCPESRDVTCIMCVFPEVCDPRSRKCQAPATICESDIDCPGDQYCDVQMDPPICVPKIPDCLDDLLDDPVRNDTAPEARALPLSPIGEPTAFEELKLCPGDTDWYRFNLPAGSFLTIDARFRHADGDLDLQLFLEDGSTLVDESRSTNDNERVQLEAGTDITVLLRIFYAVPQINPAPYTLSVLLDPSDLCSDDGNEPDDSSGTAKVLTTDEPKQGRLCAADPDWYVLPAVPAATAIRLRLDFTDSLGDLDLELYRAGQVVPLLASRGFLDFEEIRYDASYPGDYFIRVVGKGGDSNVYTLRAELRDNPESACLDDGFEVNNLPSTATSAEAMLGIPQFNLTVCSGDEDWYTLELGPGEAMTAEIGFLPNADLELSLFELSPTLDPRSSPVRYSRGTAPREFLAYRSLTAQEYALRVHGHNAQQISPYDLRIDRFPPRVGCTPDLYDQQGRGMSLQTAVDMPLPPTRVEALSLCGGDEDWYRIFLQGGFNNIVRLQYFGVEANADIALWDTAGGFLGATGGQVCADDGDCNGGSRCDPVIGRCVPINGDLVGDLKQFGVNVTGAGFAVLVMSVYSARNYETPYNLTIDLIPIFNCFPDFAEPNEHIGIASLVASSTIAPIELRGMTMCTSNNSPLTGNGDEDWYELHPPAIGSRIEASLDHTQGDMFMELIGPTGAGRACLNFGNDRCFSDGNGLTEMITFTASVAGPYFLRVGSIYSDPNIPIVPPDADTPYNLTIDYVGP